MYYLVTSLNCHATNFFQIQFVNTKTTYATIGLYHHSPQSGSMFAPSVIGFSVIGFPWINVKMLIMVKDTTQSASYMTEALN